MGSQDNVLRGIARSLRDVAGRGLENLAGFCFALAGVSLIGVGMHWVVVKLDCYPIAALMFIVVCASLWLGLVGIFKPAWGRGAAGKIHEGFVVGLSVGTGIVWICIFALFSYLLLRLGAVEFVITAHPEAPLSDLLNTYTSYFLDLVPLLQINDALGWKKDVDLGGGWRGVLLLLFRVVIVYQVFALMKRLLKVRPVEHEHS